ncbi:DUF47 domain-containing protein [Halopenitus salinus]|uniref:DUF47 domain-containing protein n=1 Tax=Halopenitus salinus TaxID=1198295 RepID=A0ABD5UUP5_9EURY
MAADSDSRFDDRIVSRTEDYLDRISECVGLLPRLLETYLAEGTDETTAGTDSVAASIVNLESDCDRLKRDISGQITNADAADVGLLNARIHRNSSQVLDLYQRLDVIANVAERIAEELVTVRPPRDADCFDRYVEMAGFAIRGMDALSAAVSRYVRLLRSPSRSGTIADEIASVRGIESAVDELRNEVVETAFADDGVDRPLVHREFALLFDALCDAMEDVTDTLVLVSSTEAWITTEFDDRGSDLE